LFLVAKLPELCYTFKYQRTKEAFMETRKKRIFSGIQPTSTPHLGNYLGAVKNWVSMQDEYDCFYSIVDLHAITVRQEPAKLRKQILESYALLIAMGIDPEKSVTFVQGHNPRHAELSWILSCFTQFGELSRMTQFKDKSKAHPENINVGLFTYPVLMAADILVYNADLVPVGADQKQHLELARNIAQRINSTYNSEVFTLPEPYITKHTARIMSLQNPEKKMSKSDENPSSVISVLDERDVIIKKFKRAVTDSESQICVADHKHGINNLLAIYSGVTGKTIPEAEAEFAGKGYGEFKVAVGEVVADFLSPVQERYKALISDRAYLDSCMKTGAERAYAASEYALRKFRKKIGFI
jgi:tryptophanyl-tRNA synthetase